MNAPSDGGPAFPVSDLGTHGTFGMSLRDWFAGQALAGMIRHPHDTNWMGTINYARFAYLAADAMLVERAKPTSEPSA